MPVTIRVNQGAEGGVAGSTEIVERAAQVTARDQACEEGQLSITLLDDDGMARLNREWLDREGPTDVLAFALHEPGQAVVGDIYLGVQRAVDQAREEAEPPARELARLAVHGTLHVLGWDHPEVDREQSEMWRNQERIVASLELE